MAEGLKLFWIYLCIFVILPIFAGCEMELVGQRTVDLIVFDILKDHVSIHQPLPRVIASTYSPVWGD